MPRSHVHSWKGVLNLDTGCFSVVDDKAQTMIAVGTEKSVAFIETTNFTKVKEISVNSEVCSLAFNERNDCLLAVTYNGEVHSFKF